MHYRQYHYFVAINAIKERIGKSSDQTSAYIIFNHRPLFCRTNKIIERRFDFSKKIQPQTRCLHFIIDGGIKHFLFRRKKEANRFNHN